MTARRFPYRHRTDRFADRRTATNGAPVAPVGLDGKLAVENARARPPVQPHISDVSTAERHLVTGPFVNVQAVPPFHGAIHQVPFGCSTNQ